MLKGQKQTSARLSSTNEVNDAWSICAERLRPMLTIPIVQDLSCWEVSWALALEDPPEIIDSVCEQEHLPQSAISREKSLNQCDPRGRGGKVSAFIWMPQSYLGLQVTAWNKAHSFFPKKLREGKLENILKDFSENIYFRKKPSQTLVFSPGF